MTRVKIKTTFHDLSSEHQDLIESGSVSLTPEANFTFLFSVINDSLDKPIAEALCNQFSATMLDDCDFTSDYSMPLLVINNKKFSNMTVIAKHILSEDNYNKLRNSKYNLLFPLSTVGDIKLQPSHPSRLKSDESLGGTV